MLYEKYQNTNFPKLCTFWHTSIKNYVKINYERLLYLGTNFLIFLNEYVTFIAEIEIIIKYIL